MNKDAEAVLDIMFKNSRHSRKRILDGVMHLEKRAIALSNLPSAKAGANPHIILRVLCTIILSRADGINPNLSTIANEIGISRQTLRNNHKKNPNSSQLVQEVGRTVYAVNPITPVMMGWFDDAIDDFKEDQPIE